MIIHNLISERSDVLKIILNTHKVSSLYAFGSTVTGQYRPSVSDIDLIVEVNENDPIKKGEHLLKLWDQLEEFFNNKVDLLTEASIKRLLASLKGFKKDMDVWKTVPYAIIEETATLIKQLEEVA